MPMNQPIAVIFDGYCKACTRIVRFLRRRDPEGLITTLPNQGPDVLATYHLTQEEVQRAVWVIEADGTRYEGAAAANRIFRQLGGVWSLVARLYDVAPIRWLENAFYHWFSRNRHHFGWMWSNREFCEEPGADCLPPWDAIVEASTGPTPQAVGGGGGGVPGKPESHAD
jgi:predicted DCC family thiol-disulfide oxidoreductase YuxK